MLRKTLTTLSLIGLLLSLGLWGVSYFEVWYGSEKTDGYAIVLSEGAIIYVFLPGEADDPGWSIQEFGGFDTLWLPVYEYDTYHSLLLAWYLPLWIPTTVFAALSLWLGYVPMGRCRKRKKLGLCLGCGYNLRGLTELRCPECNTPFEKCSARP